VKEQVWKKKIYPGIRPGNHQFKGNFV